MKKSIYLIVCLILFFIFHNKPLFAEESMLTLKQQLDRLQREVNDLSKSVFRDSNQSNATSKDNNDSQTEKFAAIDMRIYDLEKVIKKLTINYTTPIDLEEDIRNLTMNLEEMVFKLDKINNRMSKIEKDFDIKLQKIVVENSKENSEEIRSFAKLLADAMSTVNRLIIPKQSVSEEKAMDILSLRTEYDIKGEVFCSENTDWTVILSDEEGLAKPCFSRVVFVRPVNNLHTIEKYQNRKIQSISLEVADQNQRIELADQITKNGGDRCPRMGMMSLYSSPWDGMFAIDRLVRWIPLDVN